MNMQDAESGRVIPLPGKYAIEVNGNHSTERQRFTVLHEIAHIILGLPSSHSEITTADLLHRYDYRLPEEILCDVFAAECLLPYHFFQSDVQNTDPSIKTINELASKY